MVLALTPSAQLDDMTVDQEHLFPYRFGFDANRSIRAQIIALKHQYDLTDMDIRSLRHAGQLIIRGDQAKLTPKSPHANTLVGSTSRYSVLFFSLCGHHCDELSR